MELILASASPRRRELLELMGLPFTVIVSGEKEIPPENASVSEVVCALSCQKAEHVYKEHPDACVIGADTVVELDGEILGKPHTPENAYAYLKRLQGRSHNVYTGLTVITKAGPDTRFCKTHVTFRPMTDDEIRWYVSTGDPLDKAGSYGVQGLACFFVDKIEGNYFNVVGMPIPLLYDMLLDAGVIDHAHRIL